ncbi:Anthocyanidin 3-O-glucosyltransferase [Triticum urartu]|uniref:Anthocyanidin 3-O-glucosyltransferase n=1 Tax=Triticum urartu TaxID=4572 RepID=M7ZJ52_TRIUA|nr:Anthocyanidin 3-O-glucosyltransferase [Triticum urartu]
MAAVPHVVVITFPFASHAVKLFRLARALAAAAPAATFSFLSTAGSIAQLQEKNQDALEANLRFVELLTWHPGLGSYRVRDLPDGCVFGEMHLPIVALFRRVAEQLHVPRAATAVALNTFPGLLPDDVTAALATELPEVLPIGPFHLLPVPGDDDNAAAADPHGCLAWLDGHPALAVAYASFGTVVTAVVGGQEELRELASGLEASGAPFLWSLPKEYWPLLPPGVPDLERGQVGVAGGVPMACRPFFSDQRMNARMVEHVWGFGTVFEQPMTRATVAEAVSSLLAGDQGTRMKEMRGMAATAFAPEGGSRKNLDKLLKIEDEAVAAP